jgi:hypothetical protein
MRLAAAMPKMNVSTRIVCAQYVLSGVAGQTITRISATAAIPRSICCFCVQPLGSTPFGTFIRLSRTGRAA